MTPGDAGPMDDAVRRLCRPGTAAGLDRLGPQELQVSVQLRPLRCYVEVATKSHQPIRHRVVRIGGGPRLTERSGCDGHRRERLHQNGADHSMPARADDGTSLGNLHAVLRQLRGHVRRLFGGAGPRQLPFQWMCTCPNVARHPYLYGRADPAAGKSGEGAASVELGREEPNKHS